MSETDSIRNRIKQHRVQRGWSQAEVAQKAGISRAAVSAIEQQRLVPSVSAALALAKVFGCSVENLFGTHVAATSDPTWAWSPSAAPCRYFQAEIDGRTLLYPAEFGPSLAVPHDNVWRGDSIATSRGDLSESTLVMACCDPAAGLLAAEFARRTNFRLIIFQRSSRQALELLQQGLVHVAGLHLATKNRDSDHASRVKQELGVGYTLVRGACWQEGIAVSPRLGIRSVREALDRKLRWVGREAGSGARDCLDAISESRVHPRHLASDHRGVAEAIRSGWADAGVCLRIASDEAHLSFLKVRDEIYDLCYSDRHEGDPRIRALVGMLRTARHHKLFGDLPGYDTSETGELQRV